MPRMSFMEAIAAGLQDGGVELVTAYPGFGAHRLAGALGTELFSINEKNALAVAWGASVGGIRAASIFKNVGLNDAADPFINACALGVRAGLVLVVIDDIRAGDSQLRLDSRPYSAFPCALWLEPPTVGEAYRLTRESFSVSEQLQSPVVIRLTDLHLRCTATEPVDRLPADASSPPAAWQNKPGRWVAHPAYGEYQRKRLQRREEAIQEWVDRQYSLPEAAGPVCRITFGLIPRHCVAERHLELFTLPVPGFLGRLARQVERFEIWEHGCAWVCREILFGSFHSRLCHRAPTVPCSHRFHHASRYDDLYALLRSVPRSILVGDLGSYTLDTHRSIEVCLCYGCSLGVATGLALALPDRRIFCVLGDGAFYHSAQAALQEAVARKVPLTVFLLDNGGTQDTGGQSIPGQVLLPEGLEYTRCTLSQVAGLKDILQQQNALRLVHVVC